jgi:DinB superfamily
MNIADLLVEAFGRVRTGVHEVTDGLTAIELQFRADEEANTVAWLVWHLTRVQDDHVSEVAGVEQVWTASDWSGRFALPFDTGATGYGQSSEEVGAVDVEAPLLLGYYDAVHDQTVRYLRGLREGDLDRVVDESWDPPVTLGVRLVSVLEDDLQHLGQAAYVLGLCKRRG